MEAGKLTEVCELQTLTSTKSPLGQIIDTYDTLYSMRCQVSSVKGDDVYLADSLRNMEGLMFQMRYVANVTQDMFVLHRGTRYRITHVINEGFKREKLIIYAEKYT